MAMVNDTVGYRTSTIFVFICISLFAVWDTFWEKLHHNSVEARAERLMLVTANSAVVAVLGAHLWGAFARPGAVARLHWQQRLVLIVWAILIWAIYVPITILLPLSNMCTNRCLHFVRDAWPGGKADLSDDQWRDFRASLPLLVLVAAAHLICGRLTCGLAAPPPERAGRSFSSLHSTAYAPSSRSPPLVAIFSSVESTLATAGPACWRRGPSVWRCCSQRSTCVED
jgi:hypothetical protein